MFCFCGNPDIRFYAERLDGLLQEADESHLWLELLRDDCGIRNENLDSSLREANELMAIFATMVAKLRKRADL